MKRQMYILVAMWLVVVPLTAQIDLIPKPLSVVRGNGQFTLGPTVVVDLPENMPEGSQTIIEQFASDLQQYGNRTVRYASADAHLKVALATGFEAEEYSLVVTGSTISIAFAQPAGLFYALQTLRRMLPPGISAGRQVEAGASWSVPACTIADKPRFGWRGFMLDVGRHFFDKEQIKRVLDMMATYKLNRFHWHLTEDQGWRIEIKKYPRLTSVGSFRKYKQVWGNPEATTYYDYIPYGPYYYTQDDIKEIVAYAKERHIEIVPEIDMPGHMQAAMAAYPEFSCTPSALHEVWTDYGISYDVLNVANPAAVQFVKDILDELTALFPFEYIHIGGDECPTNAWQNNAQCQALLKSLGSTNYRDLQTHFFKQIETYLAEKEIPAHRRRVIAWNETLGGDLTGSNVTIMSWINWYNQSKLAADKKLDVIMTPQIPYYINRKQWSGPGEPFSQGNGSETLEAVYAFEPVPTDATAAQRPYYKGVQANFWTEHVYQNEVLEYLMLPRLAAVAETGWTPAGGKNFSDFKNRIRTDTTLYQLKGWKYGNHYMVDLPKVLPAISRDCDFHWFRLVTAATDVRAGKCIELLAQGSPLINASNTGSAVNRLWSNTQAAETASNYVYQWWALVEDPTHPGSFALVNKAYPEGSVDPAATASNNTGRWNYDVARRYYDFVIAEQYLENGSARHYSIRSKKYPALFMNLAAGGQQYSINMWADPLDGNSGMFAFVPFLEEEMNRLHASLKTLRRCLTYPVYASDDQKTPGTFGADAQRTLALLDLPADSISSISSMAGATALQIRIDNALAAFRSSLAFPVAGVDYSILSTRFPGHQLYHGASNKLMHSGSELDRSGEWYFTSVSPVEGEPAVLVQLRNRKSNYWIGAGTPVEMAPTPHVYKLSFNEEYLDWELRGHSTPNQSRIFPIPLQSVVTPGGVTRDGVRATGTGWLIQPLLPTDVATVEANRPSIYSVDRQIVVENARQVEVFSLLGIRQGYQHHKNYRQGTYLVKADNRVAKIIIH